MTMRGSMTGTRKIGSNYINSGNKSDELIIITIVVVYLILN